MLDRFIRTRPYLYHLTAESNRERIVCTGRLDPAATIILQAKRPDLLRLRRRGGEVVSIDGEPVHIRDQAPLFKGNCDLEDGFTFEQLVELLNNQVYFWPGTSKGPIVYGQRHFARYAGRERVTVLKIPTRTLFETNQPASPLVCPYNSGSPRCTNGRKSPRGPSLFVPLAETDLIPSKVVELTFGSTVQLPMEHVEFTDTARWLSRPQAGTPTLPAAASR